MFTDDATRDLFQDLSGCDQVLGHLDEKFPHDGSELSVLLQPEDWSVDGHEARICISGSWAPRHGVCAPQEEGTADTEKGLGIRYPSRMSRMCVECATGVAPLLEGSGLEDSILRERVVQKPRN